MPTSPPTSYDAARALLPGVKLAARERYGRLQMAFLGPFLPILIQIVIQFVLPWLIDWLANRGASSLAMAEMDRDWARERLPEVAIAMRKVERGEVD